MNFKPTLWKTIVGLVVGFIVSYLFIFTGFLGEPTEGFFSIYYLMSFFSEVWLLHWGIILVVAIIVYIIWSLFQKK